MRLQLDSYIQSNNGPLVLIAHKLSTSLQYRKLTLPQDPSIVLVTPVKGGKPGASSYNLMDMLSPLTMNPLAEPRMSLCMPCIYETKCYIAKGFCWSFVAVNQEQYR